MEVECHVLPSMERDINIKIIRPKKGYAEVVKSHGIPLPSDTVVLSPYLFSVASQRSQGRYFPASIRENDDLMKYLCQHSFEMGD